MLGPWGFHVFDCEHIEVHGGELRMYVGSIENHTPTAAMAEWLKKENDLEGKLGQFKANVEKSKIQLLKILQDLKTQGKKVCGFGATSKATTIFNYCGIGPELISFVTDNTPIKQGKFYPGVHIPVMPQEEFKNVDYAFLCAWNHFKEISEFQKDFIEKGGHWITHVPNPQII